MYGSHNTYKYLLYVNNANVNMTKINVNVNMTKINVNVNMTKNTID